MATNDPLGLTAFDPAEYLADEESIADFLNASLEMEDPQVLLGALATVARARGMSQLAEQAGLGRESLYKALKPGAQPRYETILKVVHALGVGVRFCVPDPAPQAPSKRRAVVAKKSPASRPRAPARSSAGHREAKA